MKLSSKSEYALLALLELAKHYQNDESLHVREIAALQNLPKSYLEQILATLKRGGLIRSTRGSKGGYVLAHDPKNITVWDVVNCMEGADGRPASDSTLKAADNDVIEEIWQLACQEAYSVLQKCTLSDLYERQATRQQMENMYYI
ncbi:transcriptional regulator [Nostocales cyanobacterium HT-58-2]|nr:transcriptional regulator [Nostocales cyanobacterium HT-58-2]